MSRTDFPALKPHPIGILSATAGCAPQSSVLVVTNTVKDSA